MSLPKVFCLLRKQMVNNQGLLHPYLFVLAPSSAGEDHLCVKPMLNAHFHASYIIIIIID